MRFSNCVLFSSGRILSTISIFYMKFERPDIQQNIC
jgi:hypothetical protein